MGVPVRIVALGTDNGATLAVVKRFSIDALPDETEQETVQRALDQAKQNARDFLQDAVRVVLSDVVISAGVDR